MAKRVGVVLLAAAFAWAGTTKNLPAKGVEPLNTPHQVHLMSTGGPDGYGYVWIDSNEPGWTPPAYLDPPASDSIAALGDDDYVEVPLPFTFDFYGNSYTSIFIGSNGFASFGSGYTTYSNGTIPSTSTPNNGLYVFWDDMRPPSGGHIDTATYTIGGAKVFVIEWDSIPHYYNTGAFTFEIQIYEAGDSLAFLYEAVNFSSSYDGGASATIGIENADGTDGLQYSYNTASVNDGDAILFYKAPPASHDVGAVAVLSPTGNVPVGSSVTPAASVANFGAYSETFDVVFNIINTAVSPYDTLYEDIQTVSNLAPGDTVDVTFASWVVTGNNGDVYEVVARTLLPGDGLPANDPASDQISLYGTSGSDSYGWQWADSQDPAGPTYNWLDIWGNTAGADSVDTLALGDDGEATIALYNAVQIYGDTFSSFTVGSNGAIDFTNSQINYSNTTLPTTGQGKFFALFWDDLRCASTVSTNNPNGDSLIYVGYFADTLTVIEWHNVPRLGWGRNFLFELLIYTPRGGTNRFVFQYKDMSAYDPGTDNATIGIQDSAATTANGRYILYTYDENPITPDWAERAGHAIEFVNPEPVLVAEGNQNRPTAGLWVNGLSRNTASLRFSLPAAGKVSVDLYDITGRKVRTLAKGSYSAGTHTVEAHLNTVPSGVYFVVLKAQNLTLSRRLVLVR